MMRVGVVQWLALGGLLLLTSCGSAKPDLGEGQKNEQKGAMTATKPISGPVNYVALGDSTGAGVGAREGGYVARLFRRILFARPDSRLTNLCVSGATTEDVLRGQMERGIGIDANLITLGIGINDIGHGIGLERFSQNYDEILSTLKRRTTATIIVTNIPEISSAPRIPASMRAQYQQAIAQYNRKLEELAARHGVVIFDVYTMTHEQLPSHPEYFSNDGFHPSDKGYELWAESMWPTIARAIGVEGT